MRLLSVGVFWLGCVMVGLLFGFGLALRVFGVDQWPEWPALVYGVAAGLSGGLIVLSWSAIAADVR